MSKPETLLMSYIVCDLLSKSDQTVAHEAWVKIIEDMQEDFKKAGALRQTVSQIWNRKGTFKLGFMWEYKDERAFNACQKLFRIAEAEFVKKLVYLGELHQREELFSPICNSEIR